MFHLNRALAQAGALCNAVDHAGQSALHYAASAGHEALVRALLRAGADPLRLDAANRTPLHACHDNPRVGALRWVLSGPRSLAPRRGQWPLFSQPA